jgi:hypothetical protein
VQPGAAEEIMTGTGAPRGGALAIVGVVHLGIAAAHVVAALTTWTTSRAVAAWHAGLTCVACLLAIAVLIGAAARWRSGPDERPARVGAVAGAAAILGLEAALPVVTALAAAVVCFAAQAVLRAVGATPDVPIVALLVVLLLLAAPSTFFFCASVAAAGAAAAGAALDTWSRRTPGAILALVAGVGASSCGVVWAGGVYATTLLVTFDAPPVAWH